MSNAAAAGPVSRFDRIDDEAEDQPFWLYDPDGVPVVIPSACVGFQVRFWAPNQRGLGTIVTDARNGRPLFLPRNVSPDEFAERVGYRVGRYRLFLLDGAHQRMHIDPGQIEITSEMAAARRGDLSTDAGASSSMTATATAAGAVGADVLGQVLAFVKESNAHALDQIASLQRDLAESQRQTAAQLATVVGAVSGVLSAAGTSGLVKKTTALDAAAAGAPVTVQMMPSSPATPSNGNEAPRNAAPAAPAAPATAGDGGFGAAMVTMLSPLAEKLAPVLAYGAAKKMDCSDEMARELGGYVGTVVKNAALLAANGGEGASTTAGVPLAGRELLAHAMRIQGGLDAGESEWLSAKMAEHGHLLEKLKGAVASITVEEGIQAVRTMRGLEATFTTPTERAWFEALLRLDTFPEVFRDLFVGRTVDQVLTIVRAQA